MKAYVMESVIELEINVPQARLAALFTDPQQNTRWIDAFKRFAEAHR